MILKIVCEIFQKNGQPDKKNIVFSIEDPANENGVLAKRLWTRTHSHGSDYNFSHRVICL